jgi:DNA-binding response OmpR family regulator
VEWKMDKRIMIVDDEPDVLISLKTVLEKQNYEVVTVDNGYDCIEKIEKGFKGVILMDLMMPKIDGWDTIKEIINKGLTKDVAINIITGKGTKNYQQLGAFGSYIYDYLPKPIDIKELIASIDRCYNILVARNN